MAGGVFGYLSAILKADSALWKKGMGEARDEVDKTQRKTQGFFQEMKSTFGKGSFLGQSMKLAAGGGAIAGLTMAGRELKEFTAELVEMKAAFNEGALSGAALGEKVMSSLPVLGQFWQAGRNIREMFTGEQAEEAKLVAEMNREIEAHKQLLAYLKKEQDERKKLSDINSDMHRKMQLLTTSDKPLQEAQNARDDRLKEITAVDPAAAEKLAAQGMEAVTRELETRIHNAQGKLADALRMNQYTASQKGMDPKDQARIQGQYAREAIGQQAELVKAQSELATIKKINEDKLTAEEEYQAALTDLTDKDEAQRRENMRKALAEDGKARREDVIHSLEDAKGALEEQLKDYGHHKSTYEVAQTTALRGAMTVMNAPVIRDPMRDLQEKNLIELKAIKEQLVELNRADPDTGDEVTYVSGLGG